jgi:hypothetical protein
VPCGTHTLVHDMQFVDGSPGGSCTISLTMSPGSRDIFRSQTPRASPSFDVRIIVEPDMHALAVCNTREFRCFKSTLCTHRRPLLATQSNNVLAYVIASFLSHCTLIMKIPQTHVLWLLSGALPLGVQIVVNLLSTRSWWDLHHSTLGRAPVFLSRAP